jgi:3-oxoacyl-[acyl-carrier-protein] synthase II
MTERRVVITGLGAVAPSGIGIDEVFAAAVEGRRVVAPIQGFDAGAFPCSIGGELVGFKANKFVPRHYRKAVKVMARDIEIAVAAADLAVRDAGITTVGVDADAADVDGDRIACNIGAGLICVDLDELGTAVNTAVTDGEFDFHKWGREGMSNLTPLWLLKYLPNMLACHVTIIHGARGPSNTITCGTPSGLLAVGEAARTIARGAADVAIAGGAESKLNPVGLLRQALLGRLIDGEEPEPAAACRPFDRDHHGTVIGEGGALLILEDHERAVARGARIYAEFAGFGAACEPSGVNYLTPSAGGVARATTTALADADLPPESVDLLVSQAVGVPGEDAAEAEQVRRCLGERAADVSVVAPAGAYGDLFAGAGAVNLAMAAKALHEQKLPATANFASPAEGCELNVRMAGGSAEVAAAACAGYSIGGQSGAIILKRYEP